MQLSPLLVYCFCYAMAFNITWLNKEKGNHRLINNYGKVIDKPGNVISFHVIIMFWLGVVPAFAVKQPVIKILTGNSFPDSWQMIAFLMLFALTLVVAIKSGTAIKQPSVSSTYSPNKLSALFIAGYFFIRTIFLFVYELFFRGFLLFNSVSTMGIYLAIAINVLLHALLHLFSSKKEILACIPFSIITCLLCLLFKAAWPAIILHITFSLVYEINLYKPNSSTPKIAQL